MKGILRSLGAVKATMLNGAASSNNESRTSLPIANGPESQQMVPSPVWTTPPDVFGRYYVGSTKWRHNQIKRKQLAKRRG